MSNDTNKLAEMITEKAEREWNEKANRAIENFIREIKVVGRSVYIKTGDDQLTSLTNVIRKIVKSAFEEQKDQIHDQALRDFFNKYSEISHFMSQQEQLDC